MKLGLFGGTFDPIHRGHLDVARAARRALGLECVWFVPAGAPPHRSLTHASAAHRFAMVALSLADEAGFDVSDLDMATSEPSYTWNTLDRAAEAGVDLSSACFVIGADAFLDIRSWRRYPAILDRCPFAVVSRPSMRVQELPARLPEIASRMRNASAESDAPTADPIKWPILLIDAPTADVSSTDIRRAVLDARPLHGLVPDAAARYIERHALYRPTGQNPNPCKGTA